MFDFKLNEPPNMYSPLTLAYIGDAVYEVFIRTMLVKDINMSVNNLHKTATKYVKARAQSDIIHAIEANLSDEELAVFKRGRNAHSKTSAKNADIVDYRHATGFETLIGYIYLKKDFIRLEELLKMSFDCIE